jgi:6-phosphogluconolactonase (cycloisomerase 2 family)
MSNEKMSRRTFLEASGVTLAAAGLGGLPRAAEGRLFAYVGRECENGGGPGGGPGPGGIAFLGSPNGGGIDVFEVNLADGSLRHVSSTGPEVADLNSDGMCTSADGRFLYCVNRTTALKGVPGTGGGVDAFAINRADGSLQHLNNQPSWGAMPVSVRIDKTNSRLIVANHGAVSRVCVVVKKNGIPTIERPTDSGTFALFPVGPDGSLGQVLDVVVEAEQPAPGDASARPLSAPLGPMAFVQVGAACHGVSFDRTQRWIIASDNGYDHLYVAPLSPTVRTLAAKAYPTPPGRAPRHIVAHPRAPYIYITNEREPSVSAFHFDSDTGVPRLIQTIATVEGGDTSAPPAAGGAGSPKASPSDIRMHPNGKFLYSSNRAGEHDSIAVFAVDEGSGRLTRVDVTETGGRGHREFNLDPSGRYLFNCSLGSNDVISFAVNADTGKLTRAARTSVPRAAVIDFALL